jgi:hypothetical protein
LRFFSTIASTSQSCNPLSVSEDISLSLQSSSAQAFAECPSTHPTFHDCVHLLFVHGLLPDLWTCVQQGIAQVGNVNLARIIIVKGVKGGEEFGGRRKWG